MLRVLDLFSGIGGFSLGLERTGGFRTVAFCEIDPYCRAVLRKHWPQVPCFGDVRDLHAWDVGPVDVICGGFPCQDISPAGKGAGLAGARSGLWSEYRRLIEEIRPAWVIVENSSVLRSRGLETILGQLVALGYDAEWHCIPASALGAPHQRDRIWIIAHANGLGAQVPPSGELAAEQVSGGASAHREADEGWLADHALRGRYGAPEEVLRAGRDRVEPASWWATEPDVGRVVDGVPSRVDRVRCLGNAVLPQIPEIIGHGILRCNTPR